MIPYHDRARLIFASGLLRAPSDTLVLLCLSDYCRGIEGRPVWPAVSTLAARCSMSARTVRRALRSLQSSGLITPEVRIGRTTRYCIAWSRLILPGELISPASKDEGVTPDNLTDLDKSTPDNLTVSPGQNDRTTPDNLTDTPVIFAADRFMSGKEDRDNEASSARAQDDLSFLDEVVL